MVRVLLGFACIAVLAVSLPAHTQPKSEADWTQSAPQSVQSAEVHSLVGTSFHAIHASF
jgi:hypothetical protein